MLQVRFYHIFSSLIVRLLTHNTEDERDLVWEKDPISEWMFPFISSPRFTLKEFITQPKRWFFFTSKIKDIEL